MTQRDYDDLIGREKRVTLPTDAEVEQWLETHLSHEDYFDARGRQAAVRRFAAWLSTRAEEPPERSKP